MFTVFWALLKLCPMSEANWPEAALTLPLWFPELKSWAPCIVMVSGG
jgi:hypothetical protein